MLLALLQYCLSLCGLAAVQTYAKVPVRLLSERIIELYNLTSLIVKGYVYIRVDKGMYGLPQAGKIANDQLRKRLAPFGYTPCNHTPGLWRHNNTNLMFTLVVDDFGVRYTDKKDVEHLLSALTECDYKYSID